MNNIGRVIAALGRQETENGNALEGKKITSRTSTYKAGK